MLALINPDDPDAVCLDRHAKSAAYGRKLLDRESVVSVSKYDWLAEHFRREARRAGVLPNQFQAICWVVWRRLRGVLDGGFTVLMKKTEQQLVEASIVRVAARTGMPILSAKVEHRVLGVLNIAIEKDYRWIAYTPGISHVYSEAELDASVAHEYGHMANPGPMGFDDEWNADRWAADQGYVLDSISSLKTADAFFANYPGKLREREITHPAIEDRIRFFESYKPAAAGAGR